MKKRILPKVPEHRTSLRSIEAEFHGPELREQYPGTGKVDMKTSHPGTGGSFARKNFLKWCTQGKLPLVSRSNFLDRSSNQSRQNTEVEKVPVLEFAGSSDLKSYKNPFLR